MLPNRVRIGHMGYKKRTTTTMRKKKKRKQTGEVEKYLNECPHFAGSVRENAPGGSFVGWSNGVDQRRSGGGFNEKINQKLIIDTSACPDLSNTSESTFHTKMSSHASLSFFFYVPSGPVSLLNRVLTL